MMGADMLRAIQSLLVVMALVATASEAVAQDPAWPWPGVLLPVCTLTDLPRAEGLESLGFLYKHYLTRQTQQIQQRSPRKIPSRWCDTIYRVRTMEPRCVKLRCVKRGLCDLCADLDSSGVYLEAASSGCLQYICLTIMRPPELKEPNVPQKPRLPRP